ncbi:MAG: hypothetical protein K2K02_05750 [Ruminococcus sp.]|nr:hypothetical protein [Ruminococcus sp.]
MQNLRVISNYLKNKKCESFSERFPYIRIMREEDLFFECDAYDIVVPCLDFEKSAVHSFERSVMKLSGLHPEYSDKEISEILCIEDIHGGGSLVRLIRERLKSCNMLNDDNTITENGKEQLLYGGTRGTNIKKKSEIAQVFVIRQLNNYILPFIHIGEIESEDTEQTGKNTLSMTIGSTGMEKVIKGRYIRIPHTAPRPVTPRKSDIINIINKHNKLERETGSMNILKYDEEYSPDISTQPSRVVLHMKAILQEGNVDYPLISDGFSCDIIGLSEYLKDNTKYITELMERGVSASDIEDKQEDSQKDYKKIQEFPQLHASLARVPEIDDGTLDSGNMALSEKKKYLRHHYYALEWALHYHLKRMPLPESAMTLFLSQSRTENMKTALKSAVNIGFKTECDYNIICGADSFEFQTWNKKGIPSLKTLLPLAIIGADCRMEDNMRTLAKEMPELLSFLSEFHEIAGKLRHGSAEQLDKIPVIKFVQQTRKIIYILLPSYHREENKKVRIIDSKDASQKWLDAQVSTAHLLGWDMIRTMNINLKRLAFSIAPDFDNQEQKRLSPNEFILTLSQIMEEVIASELTVIENIDKSVSKDEAFRIIENKIGRKLDNGIYSTAKTYYKTALERKKTTLNAMVIVYLAFSNSQHIIAVASAELDKLSSEISRLRGHGNDINLSMSYKKLAELRNKTFALLKLIGG